ncbi:MAG: hypothetical protein QM594_07185 [Niabella sp.]
MMQSMDLNKMELLPIPENEKATINGGYWWLLPLAIYLYDNREKVKSGVKKGINDFI